MLSFFRSNRRIIQGSLTVATVSYFYYDCYHKSYSSQLLSAKFPNSQHLVKEATFNLLNGDQQAALRQYIQALQKIHDNTSWSSNKLAAATLSDEYTSIQIQIAAILQNNGHLKDAANIYLEMCDNFYQALTNVNQISLAERPEMIKKDLNAVSQYIVLCNSFKDNEYLKTFIIKHLTLAQKEVFSKLDTSYTDPSGIIKPATLDPSVTPSFTDSEYQMFIEMEQFPVLENIKGIKLINLVNENDGYYEIPAMSYAWSPFVEEFFQLKDILLAICIRNNDVLLAVDIFTSTTFWMSASGVRFSKIASTLNNYSSFLFLQAFKVQPTLEASSSKTSITNASQTTSKMSNENILREVNNEYLESVLETCRSLLNLVRQLDSGAVNGNSELLANIARSSYILALVMFHYKDYKKAERLFSELRNRAKLIGWYTLVELCEAELKKLEDEKKNGRNGKFLYQDVVVSVM